MARASVTSKVIYSIALAVVVYLGLSFWAGFESLYDAAKQFNWWYFPLIILLAFLSYLIRFGKWQYYLRVLGLDVPRKESFIIFLAGFSLAITPGKLGEVIKSYFLKKRYGYEVTKTAPLVLADRLTDLIALVILASIGAIGFQHGQKLVWSTALVILAVVVVVAFRPLGQGMINLLKQAGWLKSRVRGVQNLYDSSYILLKPNRLFWPVVVALLAWGCETFGFYLVFQGLGVGLGVLPAVSIYSFAIIAGAVAMLPGGLGVTEGVITGLLQVVRVLPATAALATVLIRAATLWFAVLLGTVFLLIAERR